MKRRDALQSISLTVSGSIILPAAILQSCQQSDYKPNLFNKLEIKLLDEIGETIIPKTDDSLGAKSGSIGNFIDLYIANCFLEKDQQQIKEGIETFKKTCLAEYDEEFIKLDDPSKIKYLNSIIDKAALSDDSHYFPKLKYLVLLGYFTSEEGATKSLEYLPVPGRFEGDIKITDNQKSWALA